MAKYNLLGKRIPPVDGAERATGQAQFVSDMRLPRMLCGKVLRSPIPHGRILSIDTSRAARVPGVKAVITFADTPGIRFGTIVDDWYILAKDKVRFIGEEVAAVAATDADAAEEAVSLIEVQYEELPAVFDPEAAMAPGAPLINEAFERNVVSHFHLERGDVELAFRESDYIYENRFFTNQVYQAYLETMACVAEADPSGHLTLWLPIQIPSKSRLLYGKALGMSPEDIRVIKPYVGGAFGAKMESNLHLICALLALKTGRPVKIVNTREEDFAAGNPRVPMTIDLKLGLKKNGEIAGKEVKVVAANGGRVVYSIPIMATSCYRIDSLYTFKNLKADGFAVYTNTVPTGPFRGFGNAQMTFAVESALDEAAERLGIDPIDLRLRNAPSDGFVSVHGWEAKTVGLQECLARAKEASGWKTKRKDRAPNRGIGLACCNHVSGNKAFFPVFDGSSAFIRVGEDGKATLFHGEADIGQGQTTCFSIIAAEELGFKLEDIRVAEIDTRISPFGLGSFATRATTIGGNAVKAAATATKQKLLLAAGDLLEVPPEALEIKDSVIFRKDLPSQSVTVAENACLLAVSATVTDCE
ncbi:MAG: molybdopterin-dependent oxidoreductase, partial [Chloroflexi bacterium]|nr:molybdopterin-dependent oxidoreductase [Chloroflexota bacterium]